jgi:hypothetical protein
MGLRSTSNTSDTGRQHRSCTMRGQISVRGRYATFRWTGTVLIPCWIQGRDCVSLINQE